MVDIEVVKLIDEVLLPDYQTFGSVGCDLSVYKYKSNVDGKIYKIGEMGYILLKNERVLLLSGLSVSIPFDYEIEIRGRSGLSINNGIFVINGTIDSDYRGEIGIIVYNCSDKPFVINKGDRIGQMILHKIDRINWVEKNILKESIRNNNGFGSTGVKI